MKSPVSVNVNNVSWVEPRSKQQILSPISFKLSPGKIMGIVGPNGAGKSTLLRLLYRFQKPTTGVIQINGTDIWLTTPKKVAQTIAAVLQEQTSDFSLTVREIVSLGRTPHKSMFGSLNDKCDEEIIESAKSNNLTLVPKRANTEPISRPIAPPPITIKFFGQSFNDNDKQNETMQQNLQSHTSPYDLLHGNSSIS